MTTEDLVAVNRIGDEVHVRYWESDAVAPERLALYPAGCRVLEQDGVVIGYVTSHPWRAFDPPALNTLLRALPDAPDVYYIHDLALLAAARRGGWGSAVVEQLLAHAAAGGLPAVALIAVNNSRLFWRRQGFEVREDPRLVAKLASYDADARYMERRLAA